jgi:hypothetical protein
MNQLDVPATTRSQRDSSRSRSGRRGITLTEILIGIMVMGIGVISLATLFPIGLLRLRKSVHEVRGTTLAQSAMSEVRVRNLLTPPYGPWFQYPPPAAFPSGNAMYTPFSADPGQVDTSGNVLPGFGSNNPFGVTSFTVPLRPTIGSGLPVVIDPLWLLMNGSPVDPRAYRLGFADANGNGTMDFYGGEGLFRTTGGVLGLSLASEVFSSPDDISYGEGDRRNLPLQDIFPSTGFPPPPPPFLTPPSGVPYTAGSLFRERRFSWILIARKVSAGQILSPGPVATDTMGTPMADGNDVLDDFGENAGTDGALGTTDDPNKSGRDMLTNISVPGPIGPFDVTVVVFQSRDLTRQFPYFVNENAAGGGEPATNRPIPIFSPALSRSFTIAGVTYGPFGPNEATLIRRSDGQPFPEIVKGSFIMDSSFDGRPRDYGGTAGVVVGPIGGAVYRVVEKNLNAAGTVLTLVLDRPARANGISVANPAGDPADGYVLTSLTNAVAVYEKQIP